MAPVTHRRGSIAVINGPSAHAGARVPHGRGDELAAHERAVRAVYDSAPIGAAMWSAEGRLVHANPVLCDLLGRTHQELVGERFASFIDPDDEPALLRAVDDLWQGRRNHVDCHLRGRGPEGDDRWFRAHLHPVFGSDGCPVYLVSQVFSFAACDPRRDPTRELAGPSVVAESPVMLWRGDERGVPRSGNPMVARFLGLPQGVTRLAVSLFDAVHPEDRRRFEAELQARVAERQSYVLSARFRRCDGRWRWLRHRGRPVYSELGSFAGYAGASIDVTADHEHRRELEAVAQLFETVAESGPLGVLRTDSRGEVVYANERCRAFLGGRDPACLLGSGWRSLVTADQVAEIERLARRSMQSRRPFALPVRALEGPGGPTGEGREPSRGAGWHGRADLRVAPVFNGDDVFDGFVATVADVSAEVTAAERADRLAAVLDAGSDYVMVVEAGGALTYVNRAATDDLGVTPCDASGETFLMDVLEPESFLFFHDEVEPALSADGRWKGELTLRDVAGSLVPVSVLALAHCDERGRRETTTIVARDISDLKQAQWRMRELATHDYLTGLPNRVLLYERLDQAVARFHRLGQTVALLYLDLDRFKPINDGLGHHVGDAVLVALADRIHEVVRDTDTPARIGGDEFAVLVEGYDSEDLLERVAERLIRTISAPIEAEGVTVRVGVSIGIVAADEATTDADSLLARGDAAMYEAKGAGRGRYVFARGIVGEPAGGAGADSGGEPAS